MGTLAGRMTGWNISLQQPRIIFPLRLAVRNRKSSLFYVLIRSNGNVSLFLWWCVHCPPSCSANQMSVAANKEIVTSPSFLGRCFLFSFPFLKFYRWLTDINAQIIQIMWSKLNCLIWNFWLYTSPSWKMCVFVRVRKRKKVRGKLKNEKGIKMWSPLESKTPNSTNPAVLPTERVE